MLSLLYQEPETGPKVNCLKDLNLDQIVTTLCLSKEVCDYVLSVLEQPLQNPDNLIYRQDICQDFYTNPDLFRELTEICRNYTLVKPEWDRLMAGMRSKGSRMQAESNNLDFIRDTIAALETNALYCGKIAAFPEELLEVLNKYPIKSKGLIKIKGFCETRLNDQEYIRLRELAQEFSEVAPMIDKGCEISVDISENLYGAASHLIKLKLHQDENEKRQSLFRTLFGRSEEQPESEAGVQITIDKTIRVELVTLINEAMKEISGLFVIIARKIYSDFVNLADELWLYRFALRLKRVYDRLGVPYCFPKIMPADEDVFECSELYDLFLLVRDYTGKFAVRNVVPNDIHLSGDRIGLLVQGDNSSGKTTFLRAIGTAQLLAQAGLPTASRTAITSIRRKILAQFSGEDSLAVGDSAGRFETEVMEVAEIIRQLEPYSLVLFNETFQTTAFAEAAPAVYDILDVISTAKVKWIFVTHLLELYERFSASDNNVLFLKTSSDPETRYKLVPMQLTSSARNKVE